MGVYQSYWLKILCKEKRKGFGENFDVYLTWPENEIFGILMSGGPLDLFQSLWWFQGVFLVSFWKVWDVHNFLRRSQKFFFGSRRHQFWLKLRSIKSNFFGVWLRQVPWHEWWKWIPIFFNLSDFIIVASFSETKNPPQHVMSDNIFVLTISSLIFPKQD